MGRKETAAPTNRSRAKQAEKKSLPEEKKSRKPPQREEYVEEEGKLYCICRQPYDEKRFMVGCDSCGDWFHARCVNISVSLALFFLCYYLLCVSMLDH